MNVVTKCLRVCSPSVTMSMPAASWSASSRRMASRLPSSRSSLREARAPKASRARRASPAWEGCRYGGLQRQDRLRARGEVPRGEAAADVDLRAIAVTDQLEPAPACGAVGGDPVADFGRAVADGGQTLVQEIDQKGARRLFRNGGCIPCRTARRSLPSWALRSSGIGRRWRGPPRGMSSG